MDTPLVRIYTLRGFESVLAGSVQVSTGTKTSLSFQDGPVFTRVHRREGPAAPRGSRARTHGTTISQPTWPGVPDRLHPAHGAGAPGQQPFEILEDLVGYVATELNARRNRPVSHGDYSVLRTSTPTRSPGLPRSCRASSPAPTPTRCRAHRAVPTGWPRTSPTGAVILRFHWLPQSVQFAREAAGVSLLLGRCRFSGAHTWPGLTPRGQLLPRDSGGDLDG